MEKTRTEIRNDVLYARAATNDGVQRLYRAEVVNGIATGVRFWIDDEWFNKAIARMNEVVQIIGATRP